MDCGTGDDGGAGGHCCVTRRLAELRGRLAPVDRYGPGNREPPATVRTDPGRGTHTRWRRALSIHVARSVPTPECEAEQRHVSHALVDTASFHAGDKQRWQRR